MSDGTENDALAELVEQQPKDILQEDPQEKHWRAMREALRESKEIANRQNQQIEELKYALQSKKQEAEVDVDPWEGLDDDEVMEVKKAKTVFTKAIHKEAKKLVNEALQKQKSDPKYLEQEARRRYSDFDEVMSPENVNDIVLKVPSVHDAIMRGSDPIDAAYHFIANSRDYALKKQAKNSHLVDKAKHEENQKKPKSPNSLSSSQGVSSDYASTSAAGFGRLTKAEQKSLWVDHNTRLGRRV